jgi:hypothetical protein
MIRRTRLFGVLASLWILGAACGTSTISNRISLRPVEGVTASGGGEVSQAVLVGGGGRDVVSLADCAADGSLTIIGETHKSFGESTDILAVHLSAGRQVEWAKTLGGRNKEQVVRVRRSADGGYLVIAVTQSLFRTPMPVQGPQRLLIVKLSGAGVPEWSALLKDDKADVIQGLLDAVPTGDGGYVLAGAALSGSKHDHREPTVVKVDQRGQPVWSRGYLLEYPGLADAVAVLADGDLVVAGSVERPDGTGSAKLAMLLLRLSPDGTVRWGRIAWAEGNSMAPRQIRPVGDGFVVVGGVGGGGSIDIMAMQVSGSGALIWSRRYGDPETKRADPLAMAVSGDGDIVIAGSSGARREQRGGDQRVLSGVVLVLDPHGDLKRSSTIGGQRAEEIRSAQPLDGGRLCVALNTEGFGATFSDILTATWTPPALPVAQRFLAVQLDVQTAVVDVPSEPLLYRHEELPVEFLNEHALELPVPAPAR